MTLQEFSDKRSDRIAQFKYWMSLRTTMAMETSEATWTKVFYVWESLVTAGVSDKDIDAVFHPMLGGWYMPPTR